MDHNYSPAADHTITTMTTNIINGYELHDFTDEANFNQFIDLIRGEAVSGAGDPNFGVPDYDFGILGGCLFDNQFAADDAIPASVFAGAGVPPECVVDSIPSVELDMMMMGGDEDDCEDYNNDEESSGTTTTTTTTNTNAGGKKKGKVDRSRTLVSERRRRGRMKEKLYALRSLVPNITKMDKASIVGDAALYVQELQMQARKLKSEIAGLEASLLSSEKCHASFEDTNKKIQVPKINLPVVYRKTIEQMDAFQVEERGFYIRLVCNKGEGIAGSLFKALESLKGFIVQSSNLATVSDTFVLTFTLNVRESDQQSLNLQNLKLWVAGALLNQGFEFKTPIT